MGGKRAGIGGGELIKLHPQHSRHQLVIVSFFLSAQRNAQEYVRLVGQQTGGIDPAEIEINIRDRKVVFHLLVPKNYTEVCGADFIQTDAGWFYVNEDDGMVECCDFRRVQLLAVITQ